MARIYLASSWKNGFHKPMVRTLRSLGHQVYDFTARGDTLHPGGQVCQGFEWQQIGAPKNLKDWCFSDYLEAVTKRPEAAAGYLSDLRYMEWADTCLLLLPCGRSAHLEAGYMKGRGKRVIIHLPEAEDDFEPELMYLLADHITCYNYQLEEALRNG
jgi:hypothetical protein